MVQLEVFKNSIQLAQSPSTSIGKTESELIIEKKHMQKMMDAAVTVIRGEPLTNLVNKAVVQVISSNHFQLSLSGPIERKFKKLTEITVAQCKLINQLQEDMNVGSHVVHSRLKGPKLRSWSSYP